MSFTLPAIHEAIADVIPDREAIVSSKRRLNWRDLQRRTRQLGNLLRRAGLGCQVERSQRSSWESGQDHLGLYLYNGHEYLEGMVGAFKARVAPFNINYRYVDEELSYLFRDARPRALIYHASFAATLEHILPNVEPLVLLLQVDDGSNTPLLPGAQDYETALAGSSDATVAVEASPDDLYIVYTGGTTGMPKGVLWRQEDIFFAALGGRMPGGMAVTSLQEMVDRAPYGEMFRILPAPPFMHGAGHWSAFMMLHAGGTVVVQDNVRKLDADDIWSTIERERVFSLSMVGDAFARPLIEQLRHKPYDLSTLRVIGSGGALLSHDSKRAFLDLIPGVMVVDGFGASETGAQGASTMTSSEDVPPPFRMDEHTVVLDAEQQHCLEPGSEEIGWLARRGYVPLGYLNDRAKTERTYKIIDGVRYAIPGDRAKLTPGGEILVLGRDSVCINSGGEKIFAEEVEEALKKHPAVEDAVVCGTPSERWGQQVTAVVSRCPGQSLTADELRETAARELARFKLPRVIVFVDSVMRSPSGKPDYKWAKEVALRELAAGTSGE